MALTRLPAVETDEGAEEAHTYGQSQHVEAEHLCTFPVDHASNTYSYVVEQDTQHMQWVSERCCACVRRIEWNAHNSSQLCTMDSNKLRVWQVSEASTSVRPAQRFVDFIFAPRN